MLKEGRDEATQFDVRRATLLGQCAFEAYGEPAGSGVKESSVNGTSTTYIDKSYVAESFAGILEITLQGGEDLRGPDALRQAAVQVYCGRSFTKSEPRGGTSPNWGGAKLRVYVGRGETRLRVRGVTTGVMGNNLIGDAFIDLTELRCR